jgi:hypothetical protein
VGICDHFFFFVMTGKFCMYSSGQWTLFIEKVDL